MKKQLASDIKKIDEQLKNQQLPAGVRKALESARKQAQELLLLDSRKNVPDKAEQKRSDSARKQAQELLLLDSRKNVPDKAEQKRSDSAALKRTDIPVKKNKSRTTTLDEDCEEILARYKESKMVKAERVKKRERAGKPAALTVPETIEKATKAVAKKVRIKNAEDEPLTDRETDAAVTQVTALVKKLAGGLSSDKDRRHFLKKLIDHLQDELGGLSAGSTKAEKGLHLKGAQMHIFHYHTLNFDISPKAREYFQHILDQEPITDKNKSVVIAMARDVDELLGKVKGTSLTDSFDKSEFIQSAGYVMRAMYWNYAIAQKLSSGNEHPNAWYPSFLAHDLYVVANHTKKETAPKIMEGGGPTGRHPGTTYEEGDEVINRLSDHELYIVNSELANNEDSDDQELVEYFVQEGINETAAKHIVAKYGEKFRTNPLFELIKTGYEKGGKATSRHPGIQYEEGDTVVESLTDDQLRTVNDSLSNDENTSDAEMATMWVGMGIKRSAAKHIIKTYREKFRTNPLFELEKSRYEAGGKVKFKDKEKAIEKKLEGKPVPKKYRKTEGKKFTKKTATAAAQRIVGAMEKNSQKKKGRKMLLGGVALHTPPNISLLQDQNNLDIHTS